MSAEIISGKLIASSIYDELKEHIAGISKKFDRVPGLGVILVGEDAASQVYVRMKTKKCEELGIFSEQIRLDKSATQEQVLNEVKKMNERDDIDGILVQLPLPSQCDEMEVINTISPDKDVDGFHPENVGRILIGEPRFVPCTPFGVQVMLSKSGHVTEGKHVVIVGRSNIVGKPLVGLLCQKGKSC